MSQMVYESRFFTFIISIENWRHQTLMIRFFSFFLKGERRCASQNLGVGMQQMRMCCATIVDARSLTLSLLFFIPQMYICIALAAETKAHWAARFDQGESGHMNKPTRSIHSAESDV